MKWYVFRTEKCVALSAFRLEKTAHRLCAHVALSKHTRLVNLHCLHEKIMDSAYAVNHWATFRQRPDISQQNIIYDNIFKARESHLILFKQIGKHLWQQDIYIEIPVKTINPSVLIVIS